MKQVLIHIVLAAVLWMAQAAWSSTATPVEMQQVCDNWLALVTFENGNWAGSQNPVVIGSHDITVGDTILARWYDISPRGYVLVSALKEMTPVKAYSDESNLTELQESGFLTMVRETSSDLFRRYVQAYGSLEAVQPTDGEAIFGRGQSATWDDLTVTAEVYRAGLDAVRRRAVAEAGPLLTTSWHQNAPYNGMCPWGSTGRSVVGCAATAVAQILRYWQWPSSGFGSYSYLWDGDQSCGGSTPGGQLSADFDLPYDWANMPDSCDAGCTEVQNAALARLCSDAGIALGMDYGSCSSGASGSAAVYALPTYFRYSTEARIERRTDFDLPGWFGVIQSEIDAGRPINYNINNHGIVCDGYRQTDSRYEFHMNYGWGEAHTAWYVLDSLFCSWQPGSICPAAEEMMITHIVPQTMAALQFVGNAFAEVLGNRDGRTQAGETIRITPTIRNAGVDAIGIVGTLATGDPFVTVAQGTAGFSDLIWGAQAASQTPFLLQISSACPDPHIAVLHLTVSSPSGRGFNDSVLLFIGNKTGFRDDMESGVGYWEHRALPQFGDQWHLESYRYHSGSSSWKMGGVGGANYGDGCDAELRTPPFLIPEQGKLTFWHRIDTEQADGALAWDGGLVEIATGMGPWTVLTPADYTHVFRRLILLPSGTPCYSGSIDWSRVEVDLSGYSGVAQIRFRFISDGNTTDEGWYVDDVEVTGCCQGKVGNIDRYGIVDLVDLSLLVSYLTGHGDNLSCHAIANINGQGIVDLADLSALVSYLTGGGYRLPDCL